MPSLIRIAAVWNEADIIQENLDWYAQRGISSLVLDNGSTDGTYDLVKAHASVVGLERHAMEEHNRRISVGRLWSMVEKYAPKQVLLADADEFYEPLDGIHELAAHIAQGLANANIMQAYSMEFWMTSLDDLQQASVIKRIQHYSFFPSNKFRAFAFCSQTDIAASRGHAPSFPVGVTPVVSTYKLVERHYKFRSLEQARRKIARLRPPVDDRSTSTQYLKYTGAPEEFYVDAAKLSRYAEDGQWDFTVRYDGKRMNLSELQTYLGFVTPEELRAWMKQRNPFAEFVS